VDTVKYFGSPNAFSDQPITFSQSRRLNNVGIKTDLSYVKGIHNAKFGVQLSHTFLTERFQFGITDPDFNDPESPDFLGQAGIQFRIVIARSQRVARMRAR